MFLKFRKYEFRKVSQRQVSQFHVCFARFRKVAQMQVSQGFANTSFARFRKKVFCFARFRKFSKDFARFERKFSKDLAVGSLLMLSVYNAYNIMILYGISYITYAIYHNCFAYVAYPECYITFQNVI